MRTAALGRKRSYIEGHVALAPDFFRILCSSQEWIAAARLTAGPVFRAIDRWANISANGLNIDSLVPLLRNILQEAEGRPGFA